MSKLIKFSRGEMDDETAFAFPDLWEREEQPTWSRLRIGARSGEVPLLLSLCHNCSGPFGILYVLLVSRRGHEPGRYQAPEPVSLEALEQFLLGFREYLEQDGRHHLWIRSMKDETQFVYDNHGLIYAYGPLDRIERQLADRGFSPGSTEIPCPHSHHYHVEFDEDEDRLVRYWNWLHFPLQPTDDP